MIVELTIFNEMKFQKNSLFKYFFFAGRKFTTDHEWVLNNDGVGTVGITSYAQVCMFDSLIFSTRPHMLFYLMPQSFI